MTMGTRKDPSRATFVPPVAEAEFLLVADYFEGQIDLKAYRQAHPQGAVLSDNPLVIELEPGRWVYLEKFGAVVFWNPTPALVQRLHRELGGLPDAGHRVESTHDELRVHLGAREDRVGFSEVWLRELNLDKVKIISLALAQSVALDHFESTVKAAMARFQPVVHRLSQEGRLSLSHRDALKLVGFSFEVRATVLDNLTLFDDPPETWESESLAHLDGALFDQFDLEERLSAINQKLAYLSDASARVVDLLTARKNHGLEWTVIILIAVEIVIFFWKELLGTIKH